MNDERARLFTRYERLIYRLAAKFARKFNRSFEDMVEEARYALGLEICARWDHYDPEKSSESTWCYQAIYWHLQTVCLKDAKRRMLPLLPDDEERPGPTSWLQSLLQDLSDEGKTLVISILETPALSSTKPIQVKELLYDTGWDRAVLDRAWAEVAEVVAG